MSLRDLRLANNDKVLVFEAEDGINAGTSVASDLAGYSGSGYVTAFDNDGDQVEVRVRIPEDGHYALIVRHASLQGPKRNHLFVNGDAYGELISPQTEGFIDAEVGTLYFNAGVHTVTIAKSWGNIDVDCIKLRPSTSPAPIRADFDPVNPEAGAEVRSLMRYFKDIYGKKIITGQHTATAEGPELEYIRSVTGKLPALRGFDFLSYSHATETRNPSEHKIWETEANKGSVEQAIEWHKKHNGIVAFCWHWYAPTGGEDKSFYTKHTDFDLTKAFDPESNEHKALLADMDEIAVQLRRLQQEGVPVLWRPLHEADGKWFWWGAKGPEPYKKLYRWMYERFTSCHKLHHLIWVWNAPHPDWYPGDDVVDIAGMDIYVAPGNYGPLKCAFDYCSSITAKPIALTENGPIPDPGKLIESHTPWLWYMPWYGEHCTDSTSQNQLKRIYEHPYTVTLTDLPR
ncbi:glycosyl hydrolase [Paenibacillus thermotolerans]|uniref:glycosyl hydrolase n=1 Tax=Paenibacillus thermotolerans TaxID=3027807 RepID=UPI002367AC6D|nr:MULTISPECIES: glycosyl hydrolase [unclassified Paenibacillus]